MAKIHTMRIQSFIVHRLNRSRSHLCHPSPWKLEIRGTRWVGNPAMGGEEEEKVEKQRRRARVADLMWQDLTGKISSVCIHVRRAHTRTHVASTIFLSCVQPTHTPGQQIIVILFQHKGRSFIPAKRTCLRIETTAFIMLGC